MKNKLIYDIGLNDGEDSEFYLSKRFEVIAVEANPILVAKAQEKFADFLRSGQLTILNVGIWSESKKLKFYRNLDNDHWSSFDPAYGCREGSLFEELEIDCVRIEEIITQFGTPYYMKIDVEGADKIILKDLVSTKEIPEFISVEEYGVQAIDDLKTLGYERFQIVPQNFKSPSEPPNPTREGLYFHKYFTGRDSGIFGRDLQEDNWLSYDDARAKFLATIRSDQYEYLGPDNEWHDIHARARG